MAALIITIAFSLWLIFMIWFNNSRNFHYNHALRSKDPFYHESILIIYIFFSCEFQQVQSICDTVTLWILIYLLLLVIYDTWTTNGVLMYEYSWFWMSRQPRGNLYTHNFISFHFFFRPKLWTQNYTCLYFRIKNITLITKMK